MKIGRTAPDLLSLFSFGSFIDVTMCLCKSLFLLLREQLIMIREGENYEKVCLDY